MVYRSMKPLRLIGPKVNVKKIRIGYVPISRDLSSPGDRRRVVFWAKYRGHEIITDLSRPIDVLLLSERSNLSAFPKKGSQVPIIFDLVDGYLATESYLHDWFRGSSKILTGQLSGIPKPFTHFVQKLCSASSAVICSSLEQEKMISPYSKNTHVILDSHDELPLLPFRHPGPETQMAPRIIWEGLPATLGGVKQVKPALSANQVKNNIQLDFVTDTKYFRFLGKYFPSDTSSLLKQILGDISEFTKLIPWTESNLIKVAQRATAAIIPIQLENGLQYMKPENRLLIMWRLGLPCLTSASPAYKRVALAAGTDTICHSTEEWDSNLAHVIENSDFARDVVSKGQTYLKEYHTREILVSKWDQAFQSVL